MEAHNKDVAAHLASLVELRPRLGTILVRKGFVTAEQIDEAVAEKTRSGARLGHVLVQRGWLTEEALAQALAEQYDCPFFDLRRSPPDRAVAALLPESFARSLCALPVRFGEEDRLVVAVADPTNVLASDELRMALGLQFDLVVSETSAIEAAIERIWGSDAEVEVVAGGRSGHRRQESIDSSAAESAPVVGLVNGVIRRAIEQKASDIHFSPQPNGIAVRARVDGVMRDLDVIPAEMQSAVVSRLKVMGELDIAERRIPQDGRVSITFGRTPMDLRIAVLPTVHGEQVVLRILYLRASKRMRDLSDLGMTAQTERAFRSAIAQPYGCVITCGPTGSGKTTTLYAALDLLNEPGRVLTTIEDPVESQVEGVNQVEVNAKAGLTFARGLRTILRSDPDVLLVGEIRDEETARIAIQAAMTGHLVLTTLHAHDAASSIARLKDMGVSSSLLATSVNCIIAQRLARRLCTECRVPYVLDGEAAAAEGFVDAHAGGVALFAARGCEACADMGYAGRVGLYEVLPLRGRLRRLMEASTEEIFAAAVEDGMTTLREDGLRLCREGLTSLEEVRRVAGEGIR